jgi:hypothetical protein
MQTTSLTILYLLSGVGVIALLRSLYVLIRLYTINQALKKAIHSILKKDFPENYRKFFGLQFVLSPSGKLGLRWKEANEKILSQLATELSRYQSFSKAVLTLSEDCCRQESFYLWLTYKFLGLSKIEREKIEYSTLRVDFDAFLKEEYEAIVALYQLTGYRIPWLLELQQKIAEKHDELISKEKLFAIADPSLHLLTLCSKKMLGSKIKDGILAKIEDLSEKVPA